MNVWPLTKRFRWYLISAVLLCIIGWSLFTWCFGSPRTGALEAKIAAGIRHCPDVNCRIKVSSFTSFDWDRAYMFYQASKAQREQILGLPDSGYNDDVRQFVFLKGAAIVYQESEVSNFEGPTENELIIGDDEQRPPPIYSTFLHDTEFMAARHESQYGPYYTLKEIQ